MEPWFLENEVLRVSGNYELVMFTAAVLSQENNNKDSNSNENQTNTDSCALSDFSDDESLISQMLLFENEG